MMSEKLRRVRAFEAEHLPAAAAALPWYHVTGGVGWINDPNGFSLYKGEYHLFFQYHPYDNHWGPMHWGHVKTRDFVRWERLPAALAPDEAYDQDGCFSGSALELPDGRHLLLYTGVRKERDEDGTEREFQTQCIAFGDGTEYEKYPQNPVITAADLPPEGSARDFRDPKIWREGDVYRAVAGNRMPDGSGAVLLFESDDLRAWRYLGILAASGRRRGRMWECPDFFPLDGKDVLLVSPQEMKAEGLEFLEGNVTLCLVGWFDREHSRLIREREQTIDYGLDFYAPQTVQTADGRRIMIAWMQYWNSVDCPPEDLPFFGQMTVPRELRVRDGRLLQTPVRELAAYRGEKREYCDVPLSGDLALPGVRGRCLDMTVTVRPAEGEMYQSFRLDVARDEENVVSILYRPASGTVRVDRTRSGYPGNVLNVREFAVRERDGAIRLRVLLDRYSLELFVNDGEQAASFTVYTKASADGIIFNTVGSARIDVEKYELEFGDERSV